MHIWANLKNFLYDKDYFMAYFNNNLYIYNFTKVISISSKKIIFVLDTVKVTISGRNLVIKKASNYEMIVNGNIEAVSYE